MSSLPGAGMRGSALRSVASASDLADKALTLIWPPTGTRYCARPFVIAHAPRFHMKLFGSWFHRQALLSSEPANQDLQRFAPAQKSGPIGPAPEAKGRVADTGGLYVSVRVKFVLAIALSAGWFLASTWIARTWIHELSQVTGLPLALIIVAGIALVPGFMNAFLAASLLLDRRPSRRPLNFHPGVTILIAAYNEAAAIADTIHSVARQGYAGELEVLVIDDGSKDDTAAIVAALPFPWLRLIRQPVNAGKAAALNRGLALAKHDLIVTLDADCYLYKNALRNLVARYAADPKNTRAVA